MLGGHIISITLSKRRCLFGENAKNLAISPMYDSTFLNAWILHADTTARFKRCAAQWKYIAIRACCLTIDLQPDLAPDMLLKSVRVHFAYGSDGRSFFVEYS